MRTTIPLLVTFLLGALMLVEFFVPAGGMRVVVSLLQEWGLVLAATAFVLGGINVLQVNIPKIRRREKDWPYKVVLLASAIVMAVAGFLAGREEIVLTSQSTWFDGLRHHAKQTFDFLFDYVFAPTNATMFALLAFFIASAAFRAFRARNVEATLMLATAVVVMLGVIPVGEWIHEGMPDVTRWILSYPNNAGRRAILIGAALGAVATGLRVILGVERSHLGHD
jgi:hypothetical protein